MKKTAAKKSNETKKIRISLNIEDDKTLQKLTQTNSTMPSWVLGEEIAKRLLDRRQSSIEINLSALFLAHQV